MKQKPQAYLLSNEIHVEICQARRCHTRRSFHKYLLCNVILFVGRTICVAISISMMPVSCFVVSFSYWTCEMSALWFQVILFEWEVWATQHLWEHDARKWYTIRKSSISSRSCLGSLEQLLFFFRMALRHEWIVLRAWPKTWPVGIAHCSVCYCFHGNLSKHDAGLRHYLDKNLRAEKCVIMYGCNKYWSRNIEWFLRLFQKEGKSDVITWVTLLQSIRHIGRLPL